MASDSDMANANARNRAKENIVVGGTNGGGEAEVDTLGKFTAQKGVL